MCFDLLISSIISLRDSPTLILTSFENRIYEPLICSSIQIIYDGLMIICLFSRLPFIIYLLLNLNQSTNQSDFCFFYPDILSNKYHEFIDVSITLNDILVRGVTSNMKVSGLPAAEVGTYCYSCYFCFQFLQFIWEKSLS